MEKRNQGARQIYLDCSAGAAGDMLLAAALDALRQLHAGEAKLDPLQSWRSRLAGLLAIEPGGRVELRDDIRGGMKGLKVDFYVGDTHADHHGAVHHHPASSAKPLELVEEHRHSHGRHLKDILDLLAMQEDAGVLPSSAFQLAERIFRILAEAEARVHGSTVEQVHFHEVGAFDSIMDIAGFSLVWTELSPEQTYCSSVATGGGTVATAHGRLGVPPPAVVEILRRFEIPTCGGDIPHEALTPTGAACLAAVVDTWSDMPAFQRVEAQGIGLGTREQKMLPNVVRMIVGKP